MLLSTFSLSWSRTVHTPTNAKPGIKRLVLCFWMKSSPHGNISGLTSAITAFDFGLQHKPRGETPDSRPRCGRRPWDVVISATKAKTCTSCPAEYPSKLIFMQTKNPNLSGKRYIFPRDLNPPAVSVTVCWPQNILQCISHSCMKGSTIWNLNGLCDSAHLTQGWGLQSN